MKTLDFSPSSTIADFLMIFPEPISCIPTWNGILLLNYISNLLHMEKLAEKDIKIITCQIWIHMDCRDMQNTCIVVYCYCCSDS